MHPRVNFFCLFGFFFFRNTPPWCFGFLDMKDNNKLYKHSGHRAQQLSEGTEFTQPTSPRLHRAVLKAWDWLAGTCRGFVPSQLPTRHLLQEISMSGFSRLATVINVECLLYETQFETPLCFSSVKSSDQKLDLC